MKSETNHTFKAETKQLLNIFSKSLYKDSDAFIRELISNSNDAMEKQRIIDIQTNNPNPSEELQMSLNTDTANRTFEIMDTGIGLTRDQLIENIGTIASSGTKKFSELLKKADTTGQSVDSLIGQFGVGFYATFVVAEKVEVYTKSDESAEAL